MWEKMLNLRELAKLKISQKDPKKRGKFCYKV